MIEKVAHLPAVQEMFEKSRSILGYDLREVLASCFLGSQEKIIFSDSEKVHHTIYSQPALLIAG